MQQEYKGNSSTDPLTRDIMATCFETGSGEDRWQVLRSGVTRFPPLCMASDTESHDRWVKFHARWMRNALIWACQ